MSKPLVLNDIEEIYSNLIVELKRSKIRKKEHKIN